MDAILKQCVEWDVVNWSKALSFWERHVNLEGERLRCLELGSRRGGLSLWLALKGNEVICSDYKNPKREANEIHSEYRISGSITYEAIDATSIPYEDYFDIIVFKSILGGISKNEGTHLKQLVIDEVYKALKPGGIVLFAENLAASRLHSFLRKALTKWGRYWNYIHVEDVGGLFHAFHSLKFETAGFLGAFGRNEFQRNLLGKIDTWVFDRIASKTLKYIVFGLATKN